jgi:hypothetical protein
MVGLPHPLRHLLRKLVYDEEHYTLLGAIFCHGALIFFPKTHVILTLSIAIGRFTMSQQAPIDPLEEAAMALYYHAAQLIKQGKPRESIISELMSKGINRETAERMLAKLDVSRANVARKSGYRNLFIGLIAIVLCVIPLFGLLGNQAEGWQFWALIIVLGIGIIQAGRGILQITGL